jgi:hypothetical protein
VLVWLSNPSVGLILSDVSASVCTQRFGADGTAVGGEVCPAADASGDRPAVAALTDGGYMVAWTVNIGAGVWAVRTQRYAANGTPVGGVQQVNTLTGPAQRGVDATGLAGGGYVITWVRMDVNAACSEGPGGTVVARRYGPDGAPTGPEQEVNSLPGVPAIRDTNVASLSDGGYVVTWAADPQCSTGGIFARRYNAEGSAVGAETRLSDERFLSAPAVTGLLGGGYVIAWRVNASALLITQRFSADGSRMGTQVPVDPDISFSLCGDPRRQPILCPSFQGDPDLAGLDDGGYVIAWRAIPAFIVGRSDEDNFAHARRFTADGTAAGPVTRISSGTIHFGIAVSATGAGFAIAWDGPGESLDVFERRFDAQGLLSGTAP